MNYDSRKTHPVVAVVRCNSYDSAAVEEAFARGIKLLGDSINKLFKPHEHILVKPNMLQASPPEQVACTHPEVFKATVKWLQSMNVICSFGDSPAVTGPTHAANRNGLADAAASLNIPMADFRNGQFKGTPSECRNRKFFLANGVLEADGLVCISKLKTHGFTGMTGAIKNQLGCIPGLRKAEFHARLPEPSDFSRMLVELTITVNPRLYIMDAIVAMEGKGPNAGDPNPLKLLLFSTDPVALDAVAADIIGFPRDKLYVLEHGVNLELGFLDDITVVGKDINSVKSSSFKLPEMTHMSSSDLLVRLFRNSVVPKPVIDNQKCVKCGQCVKICPVTPKALIWKDRTMTPRYRYRQCIRCFCCQEICPEKAIDIQTPILGRLIRSFTRK